MTFIDNIEQIVAIYPLLAFGAVFLGVISSASPCVLSTIPLVIGFVGGYSDGDRWKMILVGGKTARDNSENAAKWRG